MTSSGFDISGNIIYIFSTLVSILIFVFGLIVCMTKLKTHKFFKYALAFFSIRLFIVLFDIMKNFFILPILTRTINMMRIASMIQLSNVPTMLLNYSSYIILIIGLYKCFNATRYNATYNSVNDDKLED